MNHNEHDTTITEGDTGYVLDCTCDDRSPQEYQSYRNAFGAGYDHWKDQNKDKD